MLNCLFAKLSFCYVGIVFLKNACLLSTDVGFSVPNKFVVGYALVRSCLNPSLSVV